MSRLLQAGACTNLEVDMSTAVYLATVTDGYGCSGDEIRAYLLLDRPLSAREVLALADSLPLKDDPESAAALMGLPPRPKRPYWTDRYATRGEYLDASERFQEEDAAWTAAVEAASLRIPAFCRERGARLYTPDSWWPMESAPQPLEVTKENGCRCSYGSHRTPFKPDVLTPEAFLTLCGGWAFLSTAPFEVSEVESMLASSAAQSAPALEEYARLQAELDAFPVLSDLAERALSHAEWKEYDEKRTRVKRSRYKYSASLEEKQEGLLRAALCERGLYPITLDALPKSEWSDDD